MAKKLPDVEAFKKIFEIADQSASALKYAHECLVDIAKSARKTVEMKPVIAELKKLTEYLEKAVDSTSCWRGEFKEANATTSIQEKIGVEACNQLKSAAITEVQHHISIKENGEYVRSFTSADGKPIEGELVEACDKSFNDWLAQQGALSKNSTLYQQDDKGNFKTDSKGKLVIADVSRIESLLSDAKKGFGSFMESRGIKLESNVVKAPAATAEQGSSARSTGG